MQLSDRRPAESSGGVVARFGRAIVGFFDSVGKIAGAIGAMVGLGVTLGLVTAGDNNGQRSDPAAQAPVTTARDANGSQPERSVDKSEIVASASVRSLARQDDDRGANDYAPDNVIDGSTRTAWVEGVAGVGRGAVISLRLPGLVELTRLRIVNGYAKSTARFLDNAAPRTILIRTDGLKAPLRRTLARDTRPQSIRAKFGTTRRLSIEVVSAYRGDRHADLAISEIWLFGAAVETADR